MKKINLYSKFLLLLILSASTPSLANVAEGLDFPIKRVTFIEGEKSVSLKLKNTSERIPYLVQTSLELLDESTGRDILKEKGELPFIVTPPLYKLEANKIYTWRVMFIGDSQKLPQDRESVYIARFRAIPPAEITPDDNSDKTQFASIQAINFKFYYRPKSLEKIKIEDEQTKLQFRLDGDKLIVKNLSPIYLVFDTLEVGGVEIDPDELFKPLKPLGEQTFTVQSSKLKGNNVTWSILDDLILPLPKITGKLQ